MVSEGMDVPAVKPVWYRLVLSRVLS